MVDKNKASGIFDQAKGMIKETIGKVTGNTKLQAEGKADKLGGHVKEGIGDVKGTASQAKDNIQDAVKK